MPASESDRVHPTSNRHGLPAAPARGRISPFLTRRDPGITGVRRLLPDASGALWIETEPGELYRLHEGRLRVYTRRDGLPNDIVVSLTEDREHGVWVGTRDGLARLKQRKFEALGVREGLTNDLVTAVHGSRAGGFWVGTRAGLDYVDGARATTRPFRPGLPSDMVVSLLEDRAGALWIGTQSGLWRARGGVVVRFGREASLARATRDPQSRRIARDPSKRSPSG